MSDLNAINTSSNNYMDYPKRLLIVDLDNTLYDWVTFYARSFRAMLETLSELSSIPESKLIAEFKIIHQKYHSSEYAFSIEELPSLRQLHPGSSPQDLVTLYSGAVENFRYMRKKHLKLYPGVRETLTKLKKAGVLLVAHSDAMVYYAVRRLQHLDLLEYFDYLYAAKEHSLPEHLTESSWKAIIEEKQYLLPVRTLPVDQHKPNPAVLLNILNDFKLSAESAVFIGDSLKRDVSMARKVGVFAVWARYGSSYSWDDFSLIVSITHWTKEDIEREKIGMDEVQPSLVIDNFSEIEPLFL